MRNPRATLHDVVLDDDDGRGGTPSTAEPGGAGSGPVRRFARRWRWPVAGAIVLSLAATSVVGSRREAAQLADLADVPGILAPLDGPVRELWTTSYYPFPSSWDLGGVLVGVSFDMAAINEVVDGVEAAALPEPKARGVDARTGRGLWSMTLGASRAAPSACLRPAPSRALVRPCWSASSWTRRPPRAGPSTGPSPHPGNPRGNPRPACTSRCSTRGPGECSGSCPPRPATG
ncbi:MAG: hypothetical protein H7269_08170 [Cellulomonas sp.]|nr:hypothetical protein [Cellulomonas sp.]